MRDQYILHTRQYVLGQRAPDPQAYLYKSNLPFDNLNDAMEHLHCKDHRAFFRDVAWDHGFFYHIVTQQLLSARKGLLLQKFAIDKHATLELPAGLYLYFNSKALSLPKIALRSGYDLTGYAKKGPKGELLLLATKTSLQVPDTHKTLFNRRVLKQSKVMLTTKSSSLSR